MCLGTEITWGSCGLLAWPAALLKQVPNGCKIRFGQFIVTPWIYALVKPLPFILLAVSSYLSNWCYCWRATDPPPSTPPPPSLCIDLTSPAPYMQVHYFYAPLHIELGLAPGDDEQRLISSDKSALADRLTAERLKDLAFRLSSKWKQTCVIKNTRYCIPADAAKEMKYKTGIQVWRLDAKTVLLFIIHSGKNFTAW